MPVLVDNASVAGRALEMVRDLMKQGRMSNAEARTIQDMIFDPEFPEMLRQSPRERMGYRPDGTFDYSGCGGRTRPKGWPHAAQS